MRYVNLFIYKTVVSTCFAILILSSIANGDGGGGGPKAYWCKYKDQMYELKYDDESKIPGEISKNPGSYMGMCDIYHDLGEYLGGDQTGDGNYAQRSDEIAICHYDESDGTWHQVYEDYTGYRKALWCEYKDGVYKTKLETKSKIDAKVASKPGSHLGPCTVAEEPNNKWMVWCKYDASKGTWKTKNDTPANVETDLTAFPGSHRGGCTYHEWHTNDYWGHCTDTMINDSTVAPTPSHKTVKEKREGPGVGDGHAMGKRGMKPRIRYKSKSRDKLK